MWKKISLIVLPIIIAVVLLGVILARVWTDIPNAIEHIVPMWLVLAVLVCACAWFIRGFRYREIVKRLGTDISVMFSTACIYVSQTANIILPARLGDITRMFILKHEKQTPFTNSFTSLIAERVYDILIIAILGLCTLPFIISLLVDAGYGYFVWLLVIVVLGGAVGVGVLFLSKKLHAKNKIIAKILEIFAQFLEVSATPKAIGMLSLTSVVIWMIDILICYIVAQMFEINISFMLVILAIVIGNLVKAIPITPGGIGTYEAALVVVFSIGGVPAATATLIAIIDHLIKNGVTLIGGIISLYGFGNWAVALFGKLAKGGKKSIETEDE